MQTSHTELKKWLDSRLFFTRIAMASGEEFVISLLTL